MERFSLTNSFTEIHSGTGACILQVQRGTMAVHVGAGTPDVEKCITFGAGEKWIVNDGNQIRARSIGALLAVVVVGGLNG